MDIKKSEIIKKIKEKLNSIFHFVVCVDRKKFREINRDYPNMVRDSFVVLRDQWSNNTVVEVVAEGLGIDKDESSKVHGVIVQIYSALQNLTLPYDSTKSINPT